MDRRKLPIGIQTFRKVREDGCYYVDKTNLIKSLFLDTLKELFEGSGELFEGLAIRGKWDWSVQHPVVRLDFSSGSFGSVDDLHAEVEDQLDVVAADAGIELAGRTAPIRFRRLIRELRRRAGQRVAVLVDEYDKPILDVLEDADLARANRDYLRGLYSTLKSADAHIRFSFTTGVSRFSKVNLFSGLNNLTDITLDPDYSAICGYAEADLDETFAPELPGLDREAIREWYNGYSWQRIPQRDGVRARRGLRLTGQDADPVRLPCARRRQPRSVPLRRTPCPIWPWAAVAVAAPPAPARTKPA